MELRDPNQKVCENCGYEISSKIEIKKTTQNSSESNGINKEKNAYLRSRRCCC